MNDAENLGRRIYFYFGKTQEQVSDAELLKADEWLQQQSVAYLDAHKAQPCTNP